MFNRAQHNVSLAVVLRRKAAEIKSSCALVLNPRTKKGRKTGLLYAQSGELVNNLLA